MSLPILDLQDALELGGPRSAEVAVSATGPFPASAVMTATPPGCPRKTALNSSGESDSVNPEAARSFDAACAGDVIQRTYVRAGGTRVVCPKLSFCCAR